MVKLNTLLKINSQILRKYLGGTEWVVLGEAIFKESANAQPSY